MKILLKLGSYAGLLLTAVPGILVFAGQISFKQHTTTLLIGTVLWFTTAPFWIGKADGRSNKKPAAH